MSHPVHASMYAYERAYPKAPLDLLAGHARAKQLLTCHNPVLIVSDPREPHFYCPGLYPYTG
jgi:hypothetical protein